MRVVPYEGGPISGWSHIRVVPYEGGPLRRWSLIPHMRDEGGPSDPSDEGRGPQIRGGPLSGVDI